MKILVSRVLLLPCLLAASLSHAQNWKSVDESTVEAARQLQVIKPEKFSLRQLEVPSMLDKLSYAPAEFSVAARSGTDNIISLPMPDGKFQRFRIAESPVMEPGLAAKYPEIKTYSAQGIDDPLATARLDFNPWFGFHAQVLSANGNFYVDPYTRGNTEYYMSYYSRDYVKQGAPFICETPGSTVIAQRPEATGPCRGTELYTYRLALACTGEYAVAVCAPNPPSLAVTLAAIVTSVNRVSAVYESELSVRLLLVANNDLLVYLDGTTDPYTNNNGAAMLGENQTNITTVIGSPNYDIGHVFSTGGGGIAGLGVVCNAAGKARGVTGSPSPTGDAFDIDYVAHEMGHQFGANHTFNSITSSCAGNRNGATAYEPGSGTTIMAYAGICGSDNIQPNSDPFFHTVSFDEISLFLSSGGSCAGTIATGNTIPVITAMNNNGVTIPEQTPFVLTGTATDANGDALTYCWEEWDLDNQGAWDGGDANDAPKFKSRVPKNNGTRMIPDINVILAGYPAAPAATMGGLKGETLPNPNGSQTKEMKFRLTVRDNRVGGGGIATGGGDAASPGCSLATPFSVFVKGGTGAFTVNAPNGAENWLGGTNQTVTWNVASTDIAPINTSNVNILMSTDGGLTYPTTVLANTPNDGSQQVTVPNIPTNTTVRFMIQAVGNIFFDISNANFTITFNTVLPVGLLHFTATARVSFVDLDWKTAYEENSRGFEIQRSKDNAADFATIGFVNSLGNGVADREYEYLDNTVAKNTRYFYRLKQTDLDGKTSYSPVRAVILNDSKLANISINPNPVVSDQLTLLLNENKLNTLDVQVLDAAGRQLSATRFSNTAPGASLQVPVHNLPAGLYLLRLVAGDDIEVLRFVRQ